MQRDSDGKYGSSHWVVLVIGVLVSMLVVVLGGCSGQDKAMESERQRVMETAKNIENEFLLIRNEVKNLATVVTGLYADRERLLKEADRTLYALSPNGVLYKPVDDGRSAVFVSGHVPVTKEIRDTVAFTAAMDEELMRIVSQHPAVVQAYYNDKYSYNRIYPYFDVLSQYEAGMDIPSFNFYYLADEKHNPEKKAVWVEEPYVDPAGRGWMVSAIAPVYVDGKLEGVAGIDVTANAVAKRFLTRADYLLLLDGESTVVSGDEKVLTLLEMPPLVDHQYAATVTADTYRKEDYSLLSSQSKAIRKAADLIFHQGARQATIELNGIQYAVIAEPVKEMHWVVLKLIPQKD